MNQDRDYGPWLPAQSDLRPEIQDPDGKYGRSVLEPFPPQQAPHFHSQSKSGLVSDASEPETDATAEGTLAAEIRALRDEVQALRRELAPRRHGSLIENQLTDDAILNPQQLAKALNVSASTIWRYRKLGLRTLSKKGPVRYRFGDVLAWLRKAGGAPR